MLSQKSKEKRYYIDKLKADGVLTDEISNLIQTVFQLYLEKFPGDFLLASSKMNIT